MAKKKKKSLDQLVNEVEERKRAGAKKRIVSESWKKYTDSVRSLSEKASQELNDYILDGHTDKEIIDFAYALINKYGEASSELACEMYEALAAVSNAMVPPAEPAEVATYDEVTRAVKGTMAKTHDANVISSAAGRLVKMANVDTMLKNGLRDGAEWAWIPQGDTCAFCLTLASRGWQKASEEAIKNGHAAHIHNNCDCNYVVRHSPDVEVEGYDPDVLYEQYMNAEGDTPQEKINFMRRQHYAANKDAINAKKRAAYAKRHIRALEQLENRLPEPLSRAYINHGDKLYENLQNVEPINGYEDFAVHGVPEESLVEYETTTGEMVRYNAKEAADMIREDPSYQGGNIRLLSCGAGASRSGFAEELAKELGVEVLAPTETLWVADNGEMFITDSKILAEMWYNNGEIDNTFHSTGYWKPFGPKPQDELK